MLRHVIRATGILTNSVKICHPYVNGSNSASVLKPYLLKIHTPLKCNTRNTSFLTKHSAPELWKSVTSVSNAGRRRGRAKGLARKKDLNKGQNLGVGRNRMLFPGLNSPVLRGQEMAVQCKLPDDKDYDQKLAKYRDNLGGPRRMRVHPLERGWTSAKMGGRKIGPPDPVGEDNFEGFETWILETKIVTCMTAIFGRKRRASTFVVTGNGNGLAGFALSKSNDSRSSYKTAKNRAGKKLMFIPRYKEHTVLHDFFSQFGNSKVYVRKMHEGYGLVCHRAIKCCCEAIGIKDMYAKVEGSRNLQNVIKAFFLGLLRQKPYQQLADEKNLHVVELSRERENYPVVLASPAVVRKDEEIRSDEILDFNQYVLDGKVRLRKKKPPPFYTKLPSWTVHLRKMERIRNHDKVRIKLRAEYGEIRSFLTDKYPEAKPQEFKKKRDMEQIAE